MNDMGAFGGPLACNWDDTPVVTSTLAGPINETTLRAEPRVLQASVGGTQDIQIDAGPNYAGRAYVVLGSARGSTPGINFNGICYPINISGGYWNDTLSLNSTFLPQTLPSSQQNQVGILDAAGRADAQFILPPTPSAAGFRLQHVIVVFGLLPFTIELVTNPTALILQ